LFCSQESTRPVETSFKDYCKRGRIKVISEITYSNPKKFAKKNYSSKILPFF
jgi:hypothetical protein